MEFVRDSVFNQKYNFESDILNVEKYFREYAKLLKPFEKCQEEGCKSNSEIHCGKEDCKNNEFYSEILGISRDELEELKKRTSVDHLSCPGEVEPVTHEFYKKFDEEIIKQNSKAGTTKEQTLVSVKTHENLQELKNEFPRTFFKYSNYQWCVVNEKSSRSGLCFDSPDFSSLVFCVKIYHPFISSRSKTLKVKLLHEIHVLGCQTLSELKDKIICSLDYVGDKDESNECFLKDVGYTHTAKDEYPSSFIFIENTFYNDRRVPNLVDLSKEIREWGSQRNLGPFETFTMENTKMCDLNLRIGRPYVYQHQGNCEHLMVFSDIRFLDLSDPPKLKLYPRIHCTGRIYGKHCMMCSNSYAKWLVVANERLTHDKTYLCKKCFLSYNYINGQKVGEFKAYKYVDIVALL